MYLGASMEVIWIAMIFDMLLFLGIGLGLVVLSRFVKIVLAERIALLLFCALLAFSWFDILFSGRIAVYATFILSVGLGYQISNLLYGRRISIFRFTTRAFWYLVALPFVVMSAMQGAIWIKEELAVRNLPPAREKTPNVLILVIDTLRADHLSSYGYYRDTDPNITQFATQGVLFENAYSASSWTHPSHASMLTGRWPHEHGADTDAQGGEVVPLDDRYETIGEALQGRGYSAAAFSANFETFNRRGGQGRGFIRFEDYYQSLSNIAVSSLYGRVFEYYVLHKILNIEYKIDRRLAPDVNRDALNWIDRTDGKPFFVFINYFDVHAPYVPPQPYRSRYSSLENPGGVISTDWGMYDIYLALSPEQIQEEVDSYDGAIAYVDFHINDLLEQLEERGKLDNTIVIITSDHGESFGEHGLLEHHNSLYREVIHVPLILWGPGYIPEGIRTNVPVSNKYLPATILDLIDGKESTEFPAPSLVRLWRDKATDPNDWPYPIAEVTKAVWLPPQHLVHDGNMHSVVTSEWQYIEHDQFGVELYNYVNDPQQLENLVDEDVTVLEMLQDYFKQLIGVGK